MGAYGWKQHSKNKGRVKKTVHPNFEPNSNRILGVLLFILLGHWF